MSGASILRVAAAVIVIGALLPLVSPAPAAARSTTCPDRHAVTVRDLLALAPGEYHGYWGANPRGHACFGGKTVTIRGFANWPEGLGGASISGVRPAYFEWPRFFLFASGREIARGYGKGSFYGIVVPPRFGKIEQAYHRVWVEVMARFEHPLASRCRGYGPEADRPTRAEAIATCRDSLVLTSIRVAGDPPDTAVAIVPGSPATPGTPWLFLVPAAMIGTWVGWRRASEGMVRGRP